MTQKKPVDGQEFNTSPAETQQAVSEKVKKKGESAVEKTNKALKRLSIKYVSVEDLKPNSYNPNRQSEHDFELLCKSMQEDGFTQPIVAMQDNTIVDGEHRWRAAQTLGYDKVPVVHVEMTEEQRRIATLRHNRARGSEDYGLMAEVLGDLEQLGALEWAQDSLMLDDVEINRILEDLAVTDEFADEEFSEAWEPDDVRDDDLREGAVQSHTVHDANGNPLDKAITRKADEDIRDRERRLAQAKSEQERQQIRRDTSLYRISLLFSDEEAETVKAVLGDEPAENIVKVWRYYLKREGA